MENTPSTVSTDSVLDTSLESRSYIEPSNLLQRYDVLLHSTETVKGGK